MAHDDRRYAGNIEGNRPQHLSRLEPKAVDGDASHEDVMNL